MYNLLVSGNDESWTGDPWIIEKSRCIREYTNNSITIKYGDLTQDNINELRRYPCVFAYETACQKDPFFGVIHNVVSRQDESRIDYEIIGVDPFITAADLKELEFELDISKWEMNRTHWAVKDVDLARELHAKGVVLPHWARTTAKAVDITTQQFKVGLSFPGEVRDYVESVAAELERLMGPNSYFYDNNYVSQLARPQLDTLLQNIYGDRSELVVVFLCSDYQRKKWCGIEFRAIREIIMNKQNERVMFVRMDDGDVDGIFDTDGYIDGRQYSAADIARFIQERVELHG
jgi:hypothetical protein